jgi:nitrite reductase/ring-hydroxylating ferredoxin subunit/DMSO/TMAO reductase YedYZ heme-binding membrane subunit
LLTIILCIGPLARLDPRFLPLLYNRRHFGVLTCALAVTHASHMVSIYFSFSPLNKYAAVLASNTSYGQILGFPFKIFGVFALFVLLVMAVTSHDFWLNFLTPPMWKAIHMSVYFAYAAVVLHVALGYLQTAQNPIFAVIVAIGAVSVAALHFVAGRIEKSKDQDYPEPAAEAPWLEVGRVDSIPEDRAIIVAVEGGERVAIFRYDGKLSAVANVCAHQNGPLGEGRILYGCITCPWHGFQYRPEDGCAPPPFTEKIASYQMKLIGDQILLDPRPNAPGTPVEPVQYAKA